ncbi:hypothetical protein F66182_2168 [Fusarium sp. NRRL 66182]|nr:hypothetical protein F66182_2168 [Fusarium sp. NRRL 66182]
MDQIARELDRKNEGESLRDQAHAVGTANDPSPTEDTEGTSGGGGSGDIADENDQGGVGTSGDRSDSDSDSDSNEKTPESNQTEVIHSRQENFKNGHVFLQNPDQPEDFGFTFNDEVTLTNVTWNVRTDNDSPDRLGSATFDDGKVSGFGEQFINGMSRSTVQDMPLLSLSLADLFSFPVTNTEERLDVWLNLMLNNVDYYGKSMFVEIAWELDVEGYTKTELFTVTNDTDAVKGLEEQLAREQESEGPLEGLASGTSSTSDSEETASPDSEASSGGSGKLSTGATAGIAVGAAIGGLLIIGALVWFLLRRRRRNKQISDDYTAQQTYAVDKETHGRATDSPNSPYSDENHMQPVALDNIDRDHGRGLPPTPPPGGIPRSSIGSHGRGGNSGVQTPQGMPSNVAHLVEDGMTPEEIRRLEEEERQLDDEIERAARR